MLLILVIVELCLIAQVIALLPSWAPIVRTLLRLWSNAVRAIVTFLLNRTPDSRDRDATIRAVSVRLTVSSCVVSAVGCRRDGRVLST